MTERKILSIKVKMVRVGINNSDLARHFGVSRQAVGLVMKGDDNLKPLEQMILDLFDNHNESELKEIFKKGK